MLEYSFYGVWRVTYMSHSSFKLVFLIAVEAATVAALVIVGFFIW